MVYYDCDGIATFEIRSLEPIIFKTVLIKCRVLTSFIKFWNKSSMTLSFHEINPIFWQFFWQIFCLCLHFFVTVVGKSRKIAVRQKYHATFIVSVTTYHFHYEVALLFIDSVSNVSRLKRYLWNIINENQTSSAKTISISNHYNL